MEMSVRFPNLGVEFGFVPKAFYAAGYEITIAGILAAVGMLLGLCFVVLEAKRKNQNQNLYLGMMITAVITGVVGARLYYAAFHWDLYQGDWMKLLDIRGGGLGIYGGILGGVLGAFLFCKIGKLPFGEMADTGCMGLLIGQIVGLWGNFFGRESFGPYTDSLFAMQLPLQAVRAGEVTAQMQENLVTVGEISYISVHPLFLYESVWLLVLLLFLLARGRKKRFSGEVFMLYLAGYGLGHFFVEWFRTDAVRIPGTEIRISLIVSGALFVVFILAAMIRRIMSGKRAQEAKRRKEKIYLAEEQAEAQAVIEEAAREQAAKEQAAKEQAAEAPDQEAPDQEAQAAEAQSEEEQAAQNETENESGSRGE